MSGAPKGNRNACKEPDQAVLAKYRALLLAGKITRAKMARQLGVHRATTYRWIPGLGVKRGAPVGNRNASKP